MTEKLELTSWLEEVNRSSFVLGTSVSQQGRAVAQCRVWCLLAYC